MSKISGYGIQNAEIERETLEPRIEPRPVCHGGHETDRDQCEHDDLERHDPRHGEAEEDHHLRCAVEDIVETLPRLGRQPELSRHPAVHSVEHLPHEHQP